MHSKSERRRASETSDLITGARTLHGMLLEIIGVYRFVWLSLGGLNTILARRLEMRSQRDGGNQHGEVKEKGLALADSPEKRP